VDSRAPIYTPAVGGLIVSPARSSIDANGPTARVAFADSTPGCARVGAMASAARTAPMITGETILGADEYDITEYGNPGRKGDGLVGFVHAS
jgi:hypothetical protein